MNPEESGVTPPTSYSGRRATPLKVSEYNNGGGSVSEVTESFTGTLNTGRGRGGDEVSSTRDYGSTFNKYDR